MSEPGNAWWETAASPAATNLAALPLELRQRIYLRIAQLAIGAQLYPENVVRRLLQELDEGEPPTGYPSIELLQAPSRSEP